MYQFVSQNLLLKLYLGRGNTLKSVNFYSPALKGLSCCPKNVHTTKTIRTRAMPLDNSADGKDTKEKILKINNR
ncbi:hypothetical protein TUM4630_17480 [Shewanella algidipiscicola]|uniref:Uncharacterized protein n=1 Tax=Shewanella algidipiscicola TaxID=614070 RepID=A0ABQ4PGQ3_9GAMM|nr:hypothetical protein TUM4630_17480 [Shewanella algidipiscicola]